MSVESEALDDWFAREILAHDLALSRYLIRACSQASEVPDLRQEVYVRVYEAARRERPYAPRTFLFATARHLVTDRFRRGRVVRIDPVGDTAALDVLVDELSPEDRLSAHQQLARLARAFEQLPRRCREVMWLRRVEDLGQKEIARRLRISEKAVEKQVARGMKSLAQRLGIESGDRRSPAAQPAQRGEVRRHGKR